MLKLFDESQVRAWMSCLYDGTRGFVNVCSTGNWSGKNFRDIDQAVSYISLLDKRNPQGIYARATTLRTLPAEDRRGGIDHTGEFLGFWADLDIAGPGHKTKNILPASVEDCLAIVEASGLPAPTEWVHSGGGMYPWWLLTEPHVPHSIQEMERLSADWQRLIGLASEKLGFSYGAGVGDLARVLRIPGTVNRKVEDQPTLCQWRTDLSTSQPYDLDRLTVDLHAGLKRLEKPPPVIAPGFTPSALSVPGNRPGDAFNAATTWPQLLEADGATVFSSRGLGYAEWTRPGKDKREGSSATTGHKGSDVLKVFTDSWPGLTQGETYDRFGYYAATQHNGNIREATKALAALGYGEKLTQPVPEWRPDLSRPAAETQVEVPKGKPTFSYTESGLADRMQARHGDRWRFVATRQRFGWLHWNGHVWEVDKRGSVTDLIDRIAQEEYAKAADLEDGTPEGLKEADKMRSSLKGLLSNSKQLGATSIFARRPGVGLNPEDLDWHGSKITTDNGVLDLDTLEFSDFDPKLLATKKLNVSYKPDETAPRWQKFLEEVIPDPAMRDYFQRAVGYTILGDPVRKAIFMLHGPSHTGKSQVINVLTGIFGGFAESAKEQTFRVTDSANGPTPGLHKLRGARLVTASESTEGVRLDESLIKQLTGGDYINSRPLYGDEETWQPKFTIWLATNHLPQFKSDDGAIWRRVKPIHFGVEFGKDGRGEVFDIGRKLLEEEGPGILNWILQGVCKYREHGLDEPEALTSGVKAYRDDSDNVARFLNHAMEESVLVEDADGEIEANQLYNMFTAWCNDEGLRFTISKNRFGRRLTFLGYVRGHDAAKTKRVWRGLSASAERWMISGMPLRE